MLQAKKGHFHQRITFRKRPHGPIFCAGASGTRQFTLECSLLRDGFLVHSARRFHDGHSGFGATFDRRLPRLGNCARISANTHPPAALSRDWRCERRKRSAARARRVWKMLAQTAHALCRPHRLAGLSLPRQRRMACLRSCKFDRAQKASLLIAIQGEICPIIFHPCVFTQPRPRSRHRGPVIRSPSLARASSSGGTVRPSALGVLRLMSST